MGMAQQAPNPMKGINLPSLLLAASFLAGAPTCAYSQESKPTIRHHRVEETVPDDSSSPEVAEAEAAMQRNDFAAAEPLLEKAVAAKPGDYRAWFDLGYVYNATQRPADAVDAYRKAVVAKPDVFESNLNLGLLLAKQGDNAEAAKYLGAATQLKPTAHPEEGLTRAWESLGRVEEASNPKASLEAYTKAAEISPKDPAPHLAAGAVLAKQKNLDAAAHEYQIASQLDPKSAEAVTALANIDIGQKKYPEAEAALRAILASDPQNNNARIQLGRVLAAEGKPDEAAQQLQAGLPTDANDPHAALELGTLYLKGGKNAEAEQQFRLAVQKLPRDAEAHYALGSLLMHEMKYPESQQELLITIQLKPDLGEAYGNLAVVAAENKNYPMTLQALDDRAKYLPEIPATYFLRATTYDHLKAIPQAVKYYQQFLAAAQGKFPTQEWQARHRLIALDPGHADKYRDKK
jgi:tetratricopeptide (TPR) repeat protein